MKIILAYINHSSYVEDYEEAKKNNALTRVEIEVADAGVNSYVSAIPLRWTLLDGSTRRMKTKKRTKSSFITNPNLLLGGVELKKGTVTPLVDVLVNWFFAKSLWFSSEYLYDADRTDADKLVRVLPTDDSLSPEKFQAILIAQKVTVEFETVIPV